MLNKKTEQEDNDTIDTMSIFNPAVFYGQTKEFLRWTLFSIIVGLRD